MNNSSDIADYYAEKRNLPPENICRLHTTAAETISRSKFEKEILDPIATHLRTHHLQDRILYIVTSGLPLTIEGDRGPVGDMASVDSELTLLYRYMLYGTYPTWGKQENPYFALDFGRDRVRPFTRQENDIYLVTRLTSKDLVDRALSARPRGGYFFDLPSAQQSAEASWLQQASASLKESGLPVLMDNTARVLDNLTAVQGYAAQASPASKIEFVPGALATVFEKDSCRGVSTAATGFGCYAGDPTADGYLRPQILFPAYGAGRNLAESFYMATRYLGWRTVVIGDPLAAPSGSSEIAAEPGLDPRTGLPEYFSERRRLYLTHRYRTSVEAVDLFLKAESASYGDPERALAALDASLALDSTIAESQELRARLLKRGGDLEQVKEVSKPAPAPPIEEPRVEVVEPPPSPETTIHPARPTYRTPIQYPDEAHRRGIQGVVVVSLWIDEMGQLMKGELTSGDKILGEAVLKEVRSWRFAPQLENGRPVISRLSFPIRFEIRKK